MPVVLTLQNLKQEDFKFKPGLNSETLSQGEKEEEKKKSPPILQCVCLIH